MLLCDTDVIIEFLKGNDTVASTLRSIGLPNISTSIITTMELYYGALNKIELNRIKKAVGVLSQIKIDAQISDYAVSLIEKYSKSHDLRIPDAFIAATAIVNNLHLFTFNLKDFQFISELSIYQPPR